MITNSGIRRKFKQVDIRVPRCAVIGTNEFDRFMEDNKLWKIALLGKNDKRMVKEFVKSNLSNELMGTIKNGIRKEL